MTEAERQEQMAWQRQVIREEYVDDESVERHMAAHKKLYYGDDRFVRENKVQRIWNRKGVHHLGKDETGVFGSST